MTCFAAAANCGSVFEGQTHPALLHPVRLELTHKLPHGGSSYLKEAHLCFTKCIFRSSSHTLHLA